MIEIKTLRRLEPDDLRRLNVGYTSPAKYVVKKSESPQKTTITLELVSLDHPYVKEWETDEQEIARGQEVVTYGLSLEAYERDQMVGIALAEPRRWNRSLWVWEFHIAETHRRKGLGRQLMQALVQNARKAGLRVLVCETQSTNMPAINFYRAMGFEIDGIDLSYYTNNDLYHSEVALFMKRKLEDS